MATSSPLPAPSKSDNQTSKPPDDAPSPHGSLAKSPPYWQARERAQSSASFQSLQDRRRVAPITLEDHSALHSDTSRGLWARHVAVTGHTVVGGSQVGVGAYVVWQCEVEMLEGGGMTLRKRYSDFDALRRRLLEAFPQSADGLPPLPPKSVISRFRPRFLERRREGLGYFLNTVMVNPEYASSPVLKEFVFS